MGHRWPVRKLQQTSSVKGCAQKSQGVVNPRTAPYAVQRVEALP
jgi:hypothetical protein